EESRQRRFVVEAIDALQPGLKSCGARGFDGCFVQIRCAKVSDLTCLRSDVRGARGIEEVHDLLARHVFDLAAGVPAFLADGNRGALEPSAVGISKEVVTG